MKNITLLTGLAAIALASAASAQTRVYITGSTAFRTATSNAITAVVGSGPTAYNGTSATGANCQIWIGNGYVVKTSWSGSGAGVQVVAANTPINIRFLKDGLTGSGQTDVTPNTVPNNDPSVELSVADIALSDVYQSTSGFSGPGYATLSDDLVGVLPFAWVASNGFPTGQNMTPQLAKNLYATGTVPLGLWTGLNADENSHVYAGGRNPDSGTRLTAFAETQVPAPVIQFKPSGLTGNNFTTVAQYGAETINGVPIVAGNSGESSGSTLRGFLNRTFNLTTAPFIGNANYLLTYLGASDAQAVLPPAAIAGGTYAGSTPATYLTYNGNAFTQTNVIEGKYTFWSYEHLMNKSTLSGLKLSFRNSLRTNLTSQTSAQLTPNISLTDMSVSGGTGVSRSSDGGLISANYF